MTKKHRKQQRGPQAPPIGSFREECELLASLESFEPQAFLGNADVCRPESLLRQSMLTPTCEGHEAQDL